MRGLVFLDFGINRINLKQNKIILELKSASLDIPLFHNTNRTLKSTFINSLTGGKFKKIKNITYINALNNLNIKFSEGERVGLIGHNGAGKTTFLRLISGIYTLSKGTIKRRSKIYPMIHKSLLKGDRYGIVNSNDNKARIYNFPKGEYIGYIGNRNIVKIKTCIEKWCFINLDDKKGWINKNNLWGVYMLEIYKVRFYQPLLNLISYHQ